QPSRNTDLLLSLNATVGRMGVFNRLLAPAQSTLGVTQPGNFSFVSGSLQEAFGWDVSPVWRAAQSLAFRSFIPTDARPPQPQSYELDPHFFLDRSWPQNAL